MKLIFLFFYLIVFIQPMAQHHGLFGKKRYVQFQTFGNHPLVYNIANWEKVGYKQKNDLLIEKKDLGNFGFRMSVGIAVKRNFGFAIDIGQEYSNVYVYHRRIIDQLTKWDVPINHEALKLRTSSFLGVFEFGHVNSLIPTGLTHQIGLGYSITRVANHDYLFKTEYSLYYDDFGKVKKSPGKTLHYSDVTRDPINVKDVRVSRFVMYYGLSLRTPITKRLLLKYGINYTLNLGKEYSLSYTDESLENDIRQQRMLTFMNITFGLAYLF